VRFDKSHLAAGTRSRNGQEGDGQIVAFSGIFILMGAIFQTHRTPAMTISKERTTPARVVHSCMWPERRKSTKAARGGSRTMEAYE